MLSVDIPLLLDDILQNALIRKASDIHIEGTTSEMVIRYRIDGVLIVVKKLEKDYLAPIISRLKVMGKMDIGEKRLPQDGAFQYVFQDTLIDFRLSTINTVNGEKIAIRILRKDYQINNLTNLGMLPEQERTFKRLLQHPAGLIVVCGPTGSGKTTTLYTALKHFNSWEKNILTLEDPVEYQIDGVNQIQINPKIGLNFATGLKALLRQDPNIIMLGEIRDKESAEIAIRSALTGHLVLTTLHAEDGIHAITRLIDMGIEPYMLSAALKGVVAQRLYRKICKVCDGKDQTCSVCFGTGYHERSGAFELIEIDEVLREMIVKKSSVTILLNYLKKKNVKLLNEILLEQVKLSITKLEEVYRVVYFEDFDKISLE